MQIGRIVLMENPADGDLQKAIIEKYRSVIDGFKRISDKKKIEIVDGIFNGKLFVDRDMSGSVLISELYVAATVRDMHFIDDYIAERSTECMEHHFLVSTETLTELIDKLHSIVFAQDEEQKHSLIDQYFPSAKDEIKEFLNPRQVEVTVWHSLYHSFHTAYASSNWEAGRLGSRPLIVYIKYRKKGKCQNENLCDRRYTRLLRCPDRTAEGIRDSIRSGSFDPVGRLYR